jgi:hypothetical protein
MQQIGQILFVLGIIFAFVAGLGFEHPWLFCEYCNAYVVER